MGFYLPIYHSELSPLLYSIDIWPARNSRLTQRETNLTTELDAQAS